MRKWLRSLPPGVWLFILGFFVLPGVGNWIADGMSGKALIRELVVKGAGAGLVLLAAWPLTPRWKRLAAKASPQSSGETQGRS